MGFLDDGKAKSADAKKKLTEAAGFDAEEARRNIEEVKQGLSKLGKQLIDGGERLMSSSTDEAPASEAPSAPDCLAEESTFVMDAADDVTSRNFEEHSGSEDGADEEIQAIEEKLAQLKSKRKKKGKSSKPSSTKASSTTGGSPKGKRKEPKTAKAFLFQRTHW